MTAADGYRDIAIAAGVTAALALAARQCLSARRAAQEVQQLQSSLAREQQKRAADRAGRIKAEQQLKQLHLQLAAAAGSRQLQQQDAAQQPGQTGAAAAGAGESPACADAAASNRVTAAAAAAADKPPELSVFPFTAIGALRSCFTSRTGTPRQPHLVPAARAVLRLAPGIPPTCLEGLQQFSHCWVLYVFHENTDLAKMLAARAGSSSSSSSSSKHALHSAGIKSHVKVPRLNGGKMGVLATRTPHRPVPIGLSTAQVIEVDAAAGVLVLGGVDIVDGSPVLDVKPYVPFSDALPGATAPNWVTAEADDEPLALSGVDIDAAAVQQLTAAWQAGRRSSLYPSAQHFLQLVQQVLARDIRSLHQRKTVLPVVAKQQQQQQGVDGSRLSAQHIDTQRQAASSTVDDNSRSGSSCNSPNLKSAAADSSDSSSTAGRYVVGLDGVRVSYDVYSDTGRVYVRSARIAS